MKINIVVHPGRAHLDDFLSVCFLLNHFGSETVVSRREPRDEDLSNPHTVVVDCGGQHNPSLLNFDHHQFHRDHQPCCALSLVLQYLGMYDIATETSWLRFVEVFDSKGPIAAAELVGSEHEKLKLVRSPLEVGVLQLFEEMEIVKPVFAAMMAGIARRFFERWELTANRIKELPSLVVWHANRKVALVQLDAADEPLIGLERYFEAVGENPILTVTASTRNIGSWSIYRRTGFEDVVDLSETPGCIFNHGNGFLAVTERMDFQDAVDIAVEMLVGVADFEVAAAPQFVTEYSKFQGKEDVEIEGILRTGSIRTVAEAGAFLLQFTPSDHIVTNESVFLDFIESARNQAVGDAELLSLINSAERILIADRDAQASQGDQTNPSYTAGPTTANPIHGRPWKVSNRDGKGFLSGFSATWGGSSGPVVLVSPERKVLEAAWKKLIRSEIDQNKIQAVEIHEA